MKLLVTGASGQLGRQLQALAGAHLVVPLDHSALDIADLANVRAAVHAHRPDVVINAAAYNQVDRAQSDHLAAFAANALGPRNLAVAAEDIGAAILHVSSDYVFDGRRGTPYHEFDRPNPLSVYGESKLAGEVAVQQATRRHYITRTAWLYEPYGHGFAHVISRLAAAQPQVKVVDDQFGSPTSAEDLARGILQLIETGAYGTYHLAGGGGPASWFDFASCLLTAMGIECEVVPVAGSEFQRPAPRPVFTALTSLQSPSIALPDWHDGVARFASVLRGGRS
jgi:dTDP-4-dehydrorhamnose reductase